MSGREFRDPQDKTWDDFAEGDVLITRGRTVDQGDLTVFAGLTGDMYPLHTDEQFCETTRFKTRITHGPLTFAFAVGLVGASGFYGNAITALLEVQSIKAKAPVFPGDTIHVRAEVTHLEAGQNPKYGTIHVHYTVINQRDEEVMTHLQIMLARRKTEETANG